MRIRHIVSTILMLVCLTLSGPAPVSLGQATDAVAQFVNFQPAPGSTISEDQPEISVLIYLRDDNWRYVTEYVWVEVFGCGKFVHGDNGLSQDPVTTHELPADLQSLATEVWRLTLDLEAFGCILDLPSGMDVIVTLSAGSDHRFIPGTSGVNFDGTSWTFQVDTPDTSPIAFDPPPPLVIESLSPSTVNAGSTVTVRGEGFTVPSTLNRFQGARAYMALDDGLAPVSTSVVSSSELRFTVPADVTCGNRLVQIRNPQTFSFPGTTVQHQSVPVGFQVRCPRDVNTPPTPEIDALDPVRGSPGITVTINGSGFLGSNGTSVSTVLWDGEALNSTEYVSGTQLRVKLPLFASCGEHEVQVRNPGQQFNSPPILSNATTFSVDCDDETLTDGAFFEVGSLDVVGSAALGATVTFQGDVANTGDAAGEAEVRLLVNGTEITGRTRSLAPNQRFSFSSDPYTFSSARTYEIELRTQNDAMTQTVHISAPGDDRGGSGLEELDTNGNCRLDTPEFLDAIDAWIDEAISNGRFFDAIDAWVTESDVCGSNSSAFVDTHATVAPQWNSARPSIRFAAGRSDVTRVGVRIYDLAGRPVYEGSSSGSALSWDLRASNGGTIPNGVYLYRATLRTLDGMNVRTDVSRLIVTR